MILKIIFGQKKKMIANPFFQSPPVLEQQEKYPFSYFFRLEKEQWQFCLLFGYNKDVRTFCPFENKTVMLQ